MRTVKALLAALMLSALLACSVSSPTAPEAQPLQVNSTNTASGECTTCPPPPPGGGGWY